MIDVSDNSARISAAKVFYRDDASSVKSDAHVSTSNAAEQSEATPKTATRHLAACGFSRQVPTVAVFVVSEETGNISVAREGELKQCETDGDDFDEAE